MNALKSLILIVLVVSDLVKANKSVEVKGNSKWCCQITPPSIPLFDGNGNLLFYQTQQCPSEYIVCCRGLINIQGYCLTFDQVSQFLPQWQQLSISQGITLAEAIVQSGSVDLSGNNDINYLSWENVELFNAQTGLVLDSDSNGFVYTLGYNGGDYQRWEWHFKENGWNYIKNKATGRYLESNNAGSIYTNNFNGGNEQLWMVWNNRLLNLGNNFALDSNFKGEVYSLPDNGGNYQAWYFRHL